MTMVITVIGFDTTSFSGENSHKWFDNTILCIHSKNKDYIGKHSRFKSKLKKKLINDEDEKVTGSLSSSSDPINIPLEKNRHID